MGYRVKNPVLYISAGTARYGNTYFSGFDVIQPNDFVVSIIFFIKCYRRRRKETVCNLMTAYGMKFSISFGLISEKV